MSIIPKEPEQVMKMRGGSVLGKKTILKSDHFPGCQNKRLSPQIDGAPNYRQAESLHVHGVAIPTIDGIRNVLNHIGAAQLHAKRTQVLWISLREEPLVYINGRPFVLRDVERPFSNLEYTGINRERVEQMEDRLKEDILTEAARYGNKILVTDELPDGQMVDQWEPVSCNSVKTPLEVYEELQGEGYLVDYERVPVTDEKSPKELDFDILVHKISQADVNTEIIFNCQMGRGRTTTGMVIATLVHFNRIGASGIPRSNSIGRISQSMTNAADQLPNSEEAIRRGEYVVIRSLIRVLEGGVEGKRQVDKVIDKCASMQNLREAIATYRNSILRQPDEMKREASLSFFVEYLERYYFLICFAVYLHSERAALLSSTASRSSFADWMRARPELYSIIRRLLRRDPMGALGYSSLKPSLKKIAESTDGRPSEMGVVAALRNGEVLGSQTVLKSDHCPGCQNPSLPERVDGAPNFREVPGFPVYGVANPTIDGIRSVLHRIGSSKGGRPVLWHNMREEPVIYINGKPFVLREVERPYKNMLEYTGIDRERVEKMEARLKEDILREAQQYGSAIMVIHETDDGHIFDAWENVTSDVIQTPLEVFKSLETDGFPIKYARVPITDGKAPKSSDFDTLATNIASDAKDSAFVFNCQMGRGRTTTGTVIACLVKLRIDYGKPIKILGDDVTHEASDGGFSSGDETGRYVTETALSSNTLQINTDEKQNRVFGINDILLLWKITTLFDNGVECREALDAIIDRCSALQNIRLAVLQYRKVFNQQHVEPRVRRVALNRGAEYLERYFRLIAFAAYLGSEAFDGFCGQRESKMTFKIWLHQRPEVQAMKWSIRLRPGRFFTVPEELREPQESQHGDAVMEAIVKARNGSVLGKGSILKMYFFPGQRTSSHIQIHGAPHVFKVSEYPVYSMATPTISGAKEMLAYLDAKPKASLNARKVILTDLREEAVVYINGTPFVLRELNKPVDTLKHVGITGPLVEHMEARLKEDILAEIRQSGGRMLLHREEYNPSTNQSAVVGYWENISADDVKTPAEVYSVLKDDGYDIVYRRIPLTRERDALAYDVDAIQHCKDDSAGSYLFVSHTGFGGVAYAMAIICIRLGAEANFASKVPQPLFGPHLYAATEENLPSRASSETALKMGDYRDILSLTRVLIHGPQSKADVDIVIERCAGAGHIRDDILYYSKKFEKFTDDDDEERAYLMDMGIKALRRYFFLVTFRSYLYCTSPANMQFAAWMNARPELGHLCSSFSGSRVNLVHSMNAGSGFPLGKFLSHTQKTTTKRFLATSTLADVANDYKALQSPIFTGPQADPKTVASIILGGGAGTRLFPLTQRRAKPAVPIGGCYRLVDIPMSNCINSGINKIFILTQFNSQSLNRHIARTYNLGSGINFGGGFVEVLAATQTPGESGKKWFQGTADAVRQFLWLFEDAEHKNIEHILILCGDQLYRMDYMEFVQKHINSCADISVSCLPVDGSRASEFGLVKVDERGRIRQSLEKPNGELLRSMNVDTSVFGLSAQEAREFPYIASMGIYVFKIDVLLNLLRDRYPNANDFGSEVIPMAAKDFNVQACLFSGYWEDIGTIKSFFDANLALMDQPPKFQLYDHSKPIFTCPRFLPPTKMEKCQVINSLISEGCFLRECNIEHSIVGIRSRLDSGVHLKDTMMMGADYHQTEAEIAAFLAAGNVPIGIGKDTKIVNCIIDKNARIGKNVIIANKENVQEADRPSEGFYIRSGITVVLKDSLIRNGTII